MRAVYATTAASGLLGLLMASLPDVAAADEKFFTHLHTDRAMANVTVTPARPGPVEVAIELETVEEKPLAASAVSVTLSLPRSKTKPVTVEAERSGETRWRAKVTLPKAGRWTLGLGVALSATDRIGIEAPIIIK